MGIKRRIMTSGQKFIKKHRGWLDIVGAAAQDDDVVDAVPGMSIFVGEAEVIAYSNQIIELKAFIEGAVVDNTTKIDVAIDDVAMTEITMTGETADDITINGLTLKNSNCARYAVPGAAAHGTRRPVLSTAGGTPPIVLAAGSHSMKISVQGGADQFSKTISFSVPSSVVTVTEHADGVLSAGAAPGNLKINLSKLATFAGFQPGVHDTYDPHKAPGKAHGFKIELLKQAGSTGAFAATSCSANAALWSVHGTGVGAFDAAHGIDLDGTFDNVLADDEALGLVDDGEKATFKLRFTPLDSGNAAMPSVFETKTLEIDRTA